MFQSVRSKRREDNTAAVDIAPLIDIVFILLIFFLVTTTFVREQGIEVVRPRAAFASALQPESMRVHITAGGDVYVDGQPTGTEQVAERVRSFLGRHPDAPVVVVPDETVSSRRLVEVMDEAKSGGARDIAIATRSGGGP
jgi:biopolymer transport protein ExbD